MNDQDWGVIFGIAKALFGIVAFWSWLDCWFALRAMRRHLAAIETRLTPAVAPAAEESAAPK